ncbi:MAG: alanine racemase [Candidatus Krumholzibacteria bacterium]|nr:alanine racemase [Candidatus Krumholzibacteria bacterium]
MDRLPSWVEIDLDAFEWNIGRIRSLLPGRVRILLVVKADAYGHGAVRIARQAAECGIDMLGVATLDEGKELREGGIALPVLILSPVLPEELEEVLAYDLAVSISSYEFAVSASRASRRCGYPCTAHVEVDTGMGRAGLSAEGAADSIVGMASLEGIRLSGIFTHFPASDSDSDFTAEQIRAFTAVVDECAARGVAFEYVHTANSAALINFPGSHFNMVRPGLIAYGHSPSLALSERLDVIPVMSFKARLLLVRRLRAGTSISYGRTFIAPRDMTVGVIAAGYGHGMSHRMSNRGAVLLRGRRTPIIGRVTMDMTMVDLDGFPDPAVGEEVVIFGSQRDERIDVDDVAAWDGSLNYEVLCRISKRVVRVYMKRGRVESRKSLLGVHEEQ